MANISSPVPNLVNGVSQQPPSFRLPSQGEVQENCMSSAATGLLKRPPLEHLRDLLTTGSTPPFTHFLPGDTPDEQFIAVVSSNGVRVFKEDGTEQTVSYESGTDVLLARRTLEETAGASVTSEVIRILLPSGQTHITLLTAGTSDGGLKFEWERSATGSFTGEEVTFSTSTTSAPAAGDESHEESTGLNWFIHNGQYLRVVATRATATGTDLAHVSAAVTHHDIGYLTDVTTPRDTLKVTTVENTTYILNTTVSTRLMPDSKMDNPTSIFTAEAQVSFLDYQPAPTPQRALLYVRAGPSTAPTPLIQWSFNWERPSGTEGTQNIEPVYSNYPSNYRKNVTTAIAGNSILSPVFNSEGSNQVLLLSRKQDVTYRFGVAANRTREGDIFVIQNSIQNYSDLPLQAPDDYYVEIRGAPDSDEDNYWVRFVSDTTSQLVSQGHWVETSNPLEVGTLDPASMPHSMVRNDDGTFTVGRGSWDSRDAGDDATNPQPSFVGNTITSIFSYSNRLGFLSGPNVILSELDFPNSFYRATVLALLDTAVIDVQVSSLSATGGASTDLLHAADFNSNLILFNANAQAQVEGGVSLTPQTIAAPSVSEFEVNPVAPPVSSGKDLYFSANSGNFSVIREYFRAADSETNDAVDITAHIPKYIPKNIRKIVALTSENTLVLLSDDDPGSLYVYTYFWQGQEKIQSAWSRWTFEDSTILDISSIGSELFLLVEYDHSTFLHLEKMDLSSGAEDPFSDGLVYLDRRVSEERCTVSLTTFGGGNTATQVVLPYKPDENATYFFIQRPNLPNQVLAPGTIAEAVDVDAATKAVIFLGDWRNQHFYIGHTYESLFEFSEFRLSVPQPGGQSLPVQSDRVTVHAVSVAYNDTGEFSLEVTQGHTGRTSVYPVVAPGDPSTTSSGNVRALVMAKPPGTRIVARSTSHRPFGLLSAEYSVEYTELGRG